VWQREQSGDRDLGRRREGNRNVRTAEHGHDLETGLDKDVEIEDQQRRKPDQPIGSEIEDLRSVAGDESRQPGPTPIRITGAAFVNFRATCAAAGRSPRSQPDRADGSL
jgi:hypothetical protein